MAYAVLNRVASPGDLVDKASMHMNLLEGTGVLSAYAQKLINVYRALTTWIGPLPRGRNVEQHLLDQAGNRDNRSQPVRGIGPCLVRPLLVRV